MAALLLPLDSSAQSKPKIKSVDFTIQVPTPGMSLFDAREMQFTSAKTEFGDLAATGGIQVQEIDWIGDFREDDEGDMFFKDGFIYKARIKFMVDPSGKYDTDYIFKDNDYYIDGSRISATVNGVQAKVERSAPYFIDIEVSMPVGAGGKGSMRDLAQSSPTDYELNKDSYRASQKAYSIAEADAACPDVSPLDVITINNTYHAAFRAMREFGDEFIGHKNMLVTKVIVDTDDERIYGDVASDVNNTIQGPFNIREVWLSDKVDAGKVHTRHIRSNAGLYTGTQRYLLPRVQLPLPYPACHALYPGDCCSRCKGDVQPSDLEFPHTVLAENLLRRRALRTGSRCDGSQTVLHKPRIHRQGSCGRQGFQVRHL